MAQPSLTHDQAIRARAERMWREDGSPAGRLEEYLERARELQGIIENPTAGQLPNPMTTHQGGIGPAQPVEEAALQENLGEFPSILGDQGDHPSVPMTRKKARETQRDA